MGRGRWPSTKIGSFFLVRDRTRERFRARLRVLMGRGGMRGSLGWRLVFFGRFPHENGSPAKFLQEKHPKGVRG